MESGRRFFDELNAQFLQYLREEGELYWSIYTGQSHDHEKLTSATLARKLFVGDAHRLALVKAHVSRLKHMPSSTERDVLLNGLEGWAAVLEANATGTDAAGSMLSELLNLDAELFRRRQELELAHIDASGRLSKATPAALRTNMASNADESARRSSSEALYRIERWIVDNGFADIVARRNAWARELGYTNFFEYRLKISTGMTPEQLLAVFDRFEQSTRASHREALDRLARRFGNDAVLPHNLAYYMRGDAERERDRYFPFRKAIGRWIASYQRMGVSFRGARLQIDLLDRDGKFPTGFCIAPTPGYRDDLNGRIPADVRFTSTARPRQPGAGLRGLNVLFHEAGHAAHFSNVTMNSPCFSQEFPPSSPALLETQAKFFEALPSDPAWMRRYARDLEGNLIPDEMIKAHVEARQNSLVHAERVDLIPTYVEWAIYSMDDDERTPDSILAVAQSVTERVLGISGHTGYVFATPHPVFHDMAVYYHGYLLAKMAVAQMRAYFLRTQGYIVDNPEVGSLLATHCWAPGNSASLDQTLLSLAGEPLRSEYLSDECNRSPEEAWRLAQNAMQRGGPTDLTIEPDGLQASISLVHGREHIASNDTSIAAMCAEFESWLDNQSSLI